MKASFCIDQAAMEWATYGGPGGSGHIRFKALTDGVETATHVQYIEYAPNHSDSIHQHDVGEVFVVIEGELWLGDARNGPGSIICIPRDTGYSVRSGSEGARFFRVVVP